jgi:hypothetical protein
MRVIILAYYNYWDRKIAPALRKLNQQSANGFQRIILELSGKDTHEIQDIVNANHGKLYQKTNMVSMLVVEVPFSAIHELARSKQVKRIWRDNEIKIC